MEKENPFKKIGDPKKEVPKELKNKVMKDAATLKLFMDMNSLFITNYRDTFSNLLFTKRRDQHTH